MLNFTENYALNITVNCMSIFLLTAVSLWSWKDRYWQDRPANKFYLIWMLLSIIYLLVDTTVALALSKSHSDIVLRVLYFFFLLTRAANFVSPMLWGLELVREKREPERALYYITVLLYAAYIIAVICVISTEGISPGRSGLADLPDGLKLSYSLSAASFGVLFLCTLFLYHRELGTRASVYFTVFILISVIFGLAPYKYNIFGNILGVLISLSIYMNVWQTRKFEFAAQQTELANARVAVALSQIQPHFLYNSLSAIAALCDIDPQKAKQTTLDFSAYLDRNLQSLSEDSPVEFRKELDHIEAYLRIEKTRFGDLLNVEYNITTDKFRLPSLTVQPLVENAVKHGLLHTESGGCVSVSTEERADGWYVTVSDNGKGFDTGNFIRRGHGLGLDNVRQRLSAQCGGVLTLKSAPGKGTTAVVFIPKEG